MAVSDRYRLRLLPEAVMMSPAALFSILTPTEPKALGAVSGPCVLLLAAGEEPEASLASRFRCHVEPTEAALREAASLVQEAFLAPPPLVSYDVEPGDSSEEEGGSQEGAGGIRLRVRLRREGDDKWGIKWHKQMFKSSHRLVVDEVVEGSLIDRWNECQPAGLQVRYGDRLQRINGISIGRSAAEAAPKFRAELQKEEMRALFWRPGSAEPPQKQTAAAVAVTLAASPSCGGLSAAIAVAAAHALTYTEVTCADELLQQLSEGREASLDSWQSALQCMAPLQAAAAASVVRQDFKERADPGNGSVTEHNLEEATNEATAADSDEDAVHGAMPERTPEWTYFCRKCGAALFHDLDVLQHQRGGQRQAGYGDWRADRQAEAAAGTKIDCTSLFVQPMKWMGDLHDQSGRLVCGNPTCKQKLGGFSWHGLPCSCGEWQSPAFQIHCARLDCMPAGRRTKGPAPEAVFAEAA
ncbi:Dusp12 [Symbiodinium sp. CCMP2456]|nr:Dusp12 [Symbiodinium sp. CCMP2456]